jgi:hypothetical protein
MAIGAGGGRQLRRVMNIHAKLTADSKQATAVMTGFQQQMIAGVDKTNRLLEASLKRTQRRVRTTAKKAAIDMQKIMAAPFVGGGKGGINQSMDDFMFKERQMRGVTTGLRHEVGKIRNTLLLFVFATASVVQAFKNWFNAIIQAEAALTGLRAVAIATGQDFARLQEVSMEMEKSGFLSIGGSAAALKNLAASNISMDQSIQVLKALTDAAAFNRQGTLSMEEAIVGATQGIKNQNSIMIDNAGITKNVSIMYREYGALIGKTAGSLTEMEKRQAIVNGILQEAALFAGNAEKSLSTYQGRIAKFQTTMLAMKRGLGEVIAGPILDAFDKIAVLFEEMAAKEGPGELFVKSISRAISEITTLITGFITHITEAFMGLESIFSLASVGIVSFKNTLDSPYVRLLAFSLLIKKTGGYLTGLFTKLRVGSLQKSFDVMRNQALRDAVMHQKSYLTLQKGSIEAAMQETRIHAEMNAHIKAGTAELHIKEVFQKRINELTQINVKTTAQQLELEARILTLRKLGYGAVEQVTSQRVGKGGMKRAGSLYFGQSIVPDKNQRAAYEGFISETTRQNLTMRQKIVHDWKVMGRQFSVLGQVVKRTWAGYNAGVKTSIGLNVAFKASIMAAGQAIKTIGMIVGNVMMKLVIWYTMAMMFYDIIKELFVSQGQNLERINREISLELKGLKGIKQTYDEINASLEARTELFS